MITTPKQPTLRLGIAALDEKGIKKGVIVVNICLRTFFQLLNKTTLYYVYFIDQDGKFLNHHNSKYGLLGSNTQYSIFEEYPQYAQDILDNEEFFGQKFYTKTLHNFDNTQNLKILLELKFEEQVKQTQIIQRNFTIISIVFAVLIIPILIYLAKLPDRLKEKLNQKEEIENKNIFINTLLKSIPIPMFYKNLDGTYFDINQEFSDVFGFEYEEIVGKSTFEVVDKQSAATYSKKDQELINSKTKETQSYQSTVTNSKTGKIHNVIFHKNLFFDRNNKPLGIIGAAIDITEITKIKKELELLNKSLEEKVHKEVEKNLAQEIQLFESSKLAAMGEMMNNVIHQWSQPLTVISLKASFIETLAQKKEPLDYQLLQEEMEYITQAIKRLSEVTKTFGEFIKEKKELKTIILQDVIDKSLVISGTVLKDKGFTLEKEIDYDTPITMTTIPNELIEVIINIINNAIDILEEKQIEDGLVKISLFTTDETVKITIEDNGGGIPQKVLPRIFDEYFTTKDVDKGTGIGLYMSKKIILTSLNGDLYASNTNEGAAFTIELPLK